MMLAEYLYSVVDGLRDVSVSEPEGELQLYQVSLCHLLHGFLLSTSL